MDHNIEGRLEMNGAIVFTLCVTSDGRLAIRGHFNSLNEAENILHGQMGGVDGN